MNPIAFHHTHFLIFDVGSNATKASLVRAVHPPVIEQNWRIETGLTRYIQPDGDLSREGLGMSLLAIKSVIREANQRIEGGIDKYAIGTEALRRIHNASEVVEAFREACGVELTVISSETEAELERRAVCMTEVYRQNRDKCILCLDSGGSSTEFNFLVPGSNAPISRSYPFGQHDIKAAIQAGAEMPFQAMFNDLKAVAAQFTPALVIVAGSSFTSYARYALKLEEYSDHAVESQVIEGGASIPPHDLKAACGSRLVETLKAAVCAPVYATTHGIRHGWIACMMDVEAAIS